MRLAVKRLQVEDVAKLPALVAENIDAIEPGMVVLDSRLLLGHASIDLVALDASGTLVLMATGRIADESMLLKAVEAYSWCREYPESLERLYPSCVISEERPPRLVFVVERMPDAFHRKIKQLGFPEVDCVEFRLLDADGVPAVCFDSILKLQRSAPAAAAEPGPRFQTPAPDAGRAVAAENVIALNGAAAARATSLKLQKLLNQAVADVPVANLRTSEPPATSAREGASVVSMVSRQPAVTASRPERARAAAEPTVLREAEPVVVPVPDPTPVDSPEPTAGHELEPLGAILNPELLAQLERAMAALELTNAAAPASVTVAEPEPTVVDAPTLALAGPDPTGAQPTVAESPVAVAEPKSAIPAMNGATSHSVPSLKSERISLRSLPELALNQAAAAASPRVPADPEARISFKDLAVALLGPAASASVPPTPTASEPKPTGTEEPLESVDDVADARGEALDAEAESSMALTVEALIKSVAPPAPAPAMPVVAEKPVAPATASKPRVVEKTAKAGASGLPQEFEGLKFPNDGVLTRQWLEFLSQMSSTK